MGKPYGTIAQSSMASGLAPSNPPTSYGMRGGDELPSESEEEPQAGREEKKLAPRWAEGERGERW